MSKWVGTLSSLFRFLDLFPFRMAMILSVSNWLRLWLMRPLLSIMLSWESIA